MKHTFHTPEALNVYVELGAGRSPNLPIASSEIVVTFGPKWFSRFEGPRPEDLDAVFGGRELWHRSDANATANERWENWLLDYKNAVSRAGCTFPLAFEALAKTGVP